MDNMEFNWMVEMPKTDNNNNNNNNTVNNTIGQIDLSSDFITTSTEITNNNVNDENQDIVQYLFDSIDFSTPVNNNNTLIKNDMDKTNNTLALSPQSMSSHDYTDTEQQLKQQVLNTNQFSVTPPTAAITFENHWLTSVDPTSKTTFTLFQPKTKTTNLDNNGDVPILNTSTSNTTTTTTLSSNNENQHQQNNTSASRKMRIKKNREPIFVTESPQNAYKKKSKKSSSNNNDTIILQSSTATINTTSSNSPNSSSSPSSHFDDDEDMDDQDQIGPLNSKGLTAKERKQLRNKISARNFRVRRKEYINQLEGKVDEQEDEIEQLKQENKKITALNRQLMEEIMQLKLQQSSPSNITPIQSDLAQSSQNELSDHQQIMSVTPISSSDSNHSTSPNYMDSLLDFSLFNAIDFNSNNTNNNTTYLNHTLVPSIDLTRVLDDKLGQPPTSAGNQKELMEMYPLLAPALASIVIRHTFTLHYMAYLSDSFPYNLSSMPLSNSYGNNKKEVLDILRPDDWMNAMTLGYRPQVINGEGEGDDESIITAELIPAHMLEHSNALKRLKERWNKKNNKKIQQDQENILWFHYPHYVVLRLKGYSHEEILEMNKACIEKRHIQQQQKRMKCAVSVNKFEMVKAFTSVASTMVKNPAKMPLISGVLIDAKVYHKRDNPKKSPFTLKSAKHRSLLKISAK